MHVSSISQNLRSGRWSTSALRQTWSQTASLQQLQQNRGQLWERCFVIVNTTNPSLEDYGSYHFTNLPFFLLQEVLVATHVSRMKKKWVGVPPKRQIYWYFHPVNVFLLYILFKPLGMYFCKLLQYILQKQDNLYQNILISWHLEIY